MQDSNSNSEIRTRISRLSRSLVAPSAPASRPASSGWYRPSHRRNTCRTNVQHEPRRHVGKARPAERGKGRSSAQRSWNFRRKGCSAHLKSRFYRPVDLRLEGDQRSFRYLGSQQHSQDIIYISCASSARRAMRGERYHATRGGQSTRFSVLALCVNAVCVGSPLERGSAALLAWPRSDTMVRSRAFLCSFRSDEREGRGRLRVRWYTAVAMWPRFWWLRRGVSRCAWSAACGSPFLGSA